MKTHLLASLALVAASASTAVADPDFVSGRPPGGVPHSLAASSGTAPIAPLEVLQFQHAQASLLNTSAEEVDTAAAWLRAHPGYRVVVEGHTDHEGTKLYNQDLATRRADVVRRRLIAAGIPTDRIVLVIFGENDATDHVNVNDRRVVLYASNRPVKEIAVASLDYKGAEVAVWTNGGTLFQEQQTPGKNPQRAVIATRK